MGRRPCTAISTFECESCGHEIPLPRVLGQSREFLHRKHIWCVRCRLLTRHIEYRDDVDRIKAKIALSPPEPVKPKLIRNYLTGAVHVSGGAFLTLCRLSYATSDPSSGEPLFTPPFKPADHHHQPTCAICTHLLENPPLIT